MNRLFAAILVTVALLGTSPSAIACSMSGSYKFVYLEAPSLIGDEPDAPVVKSHAVTRGLQKDVWDCTHFGTLMLALSDKLPEAIAGFRFSVSNGDAPFYVDDSILAPVQLDVSTYGFVFPWPDLGKNGIGSKPIDLVLDISQVSETGVVGPSIQLRIQHPGR